MATVTFGGASRDRVSIEVHGYERAPVGEFYDDNWLRAHISISAGGLSGSFGAAFLTSELVQFLQHLQQLHASLTGNATFSTLEERLSLRLVGDGRGHISLSGTGVDLSGNRLAFTLPLDQTHLLAAIAQLDELARSFPVRAG